MISIKEVFIVVVLLCVFVSCSDKKQVQKELDQLFYGECSVSIKVDQKKAKIYLDHVLGAKGQLEANIPCGQKSILVKKDGYQTVELYPQLIKGKPLELQLEMKKLKVGKPIALSSELIQKELNKEEVVKLADLEGSSGTSDDGAVEVEPFDPLSLESWL